MTDTHSPDSADHSPRSRLDRVRGVLRRVLHVVGILLLVALVAPFFVYAVPGVVGADASYVVLSDSMQPAIGVNDVVVVDAVDPATIQPGDVITFERDPRNPPVTHRVVEVLPTDGGTAFVTKGDANEEVDQTPVQTDAVVGTVLFVIPAIGLVVRYVGTDAGFAVLVLVPITLLALSELAAFIRPARSRTRNAGSGSGIPRDASPETGEGGGPGANGSSPAPVLTAIPAVRVVDGTALVETDPATEPADGNEVADGRHDRHDRHDHHGAVGGEVGAPEPVGIQLSKRDVAGTTVALLALAVYAGYIGYRLQDVTSVMVAAGAGMLALLGLGARATWPEPPTPAGRRGSVPLVAAPLPASARSGQRVIVESLGALHALAETTRTPVIHDEPRGVYATVDGDVVYWYDAPPEEPETGQADGPTSEPAGEPTGTEDAVESASAAADGTRPRDGGDAVVTDGSGSPSETDDAS